MGCARTPQTSLGGRVPSQSQCTDEDDAGKGEPDAFRLGDDGKRAEQPMILDGVRARNPGGEKQCVGIAGIAAVAELESPESLNDDGTPVLVSELAFERAGDGIERTDRAVPEITDEQIAFELSEAARRNGHTPWRIEMVARHQPRHQAAVGP